MTPIPVHQGWQDEWQQVKHIDLPVLLKPHTEDEVPENTCLHLQADLWCFVCAFAFTMYLKISYSRVSCFKRFWFGLAFVFFFFLCHLAPLY